MDPAVWLKVPMNSRGFPLSWFLIDLHQAWTLQKDCVGSYGGPRGGGQAVSYELGTPVK